MTGTTAGGSRRLMWLVHSSDETDYTKAANYWCWLKRKLKQDGIQFVSATHKLKIVAAGM